MDRITNNGEKTMGLAASQARFLGITARKSNIEYEGQQVNQQRTALAEEVNSLFRKLAELKVPIPPSAEEYFKTTYTFSVPESESQAWAGDLTIANYYKLDDGTYHVSGTRSYRAKGAIGKTVDSASITIDGNNYTYQPYGSQVKYPLSPVPNTTEEDKKLIAEYKDLLKEAGAYNSMSGTPEEIQKQIDADELYYYKDDAGNEFYFSKYQMDNKDTVNCSYYQIKGDIPKTDTFSEDGFVLTFDSNGRIKTISKPGSFGDENVNTKREQDTEAFDEALRDYTISKDEYNKMVEDLNNRTKTLQQEDKVLELRLNQIDTEQNELSTELEAVKAVLDKNIENTFKTFA